MATIRELSGNSPINHAEHRILYKTRDMRKAAGLRKHLQDYLAIDFRTGFITANIVGDRDNSYEDDINNVLTYSGPSTKWIRDAAGKYVSGTRLRCEGILQGSCI